MKEEIPLHPLCTLFPRMAGADFEALKADISIHGLRQPIVLHDGMILDGGNRYRACREVGVVPDTIEFANGNPVAFVLSANLHRRHMTAGQQAAIVASAQDWAVAQKAGKPKSGNITGLETVADRQAQSGASEKTQRNADKVAKADPELARQVGQGSISLPKAVEQVTGKRPSSKPPEPLDAEPEYVEPEYTELDALHDQIDGLQDALTEAHMKDSTPVEKALHLELVASLRAEIKTLTATLAAVKSSRDHYQAENAELRQQIKRQRKEIDKLAGTKTA